MTGGLFERFVHDQAAGAAQEAEELLERSGIRAPAGHPGAAQIVARFRELASGTTLRPCAHLRPEAPAVSVWTPTTHADLLSCRGCALVAPTVDLPNPPVPARCDVCGGTMTSSKRILAERVGCVLVVWTECVTCLGAEPVCLEPGEDPR